MSFQSVVNAAQFTGYTMYVSFSWEDSFPNAGFAIFYFQDLVTNAYLACLPYDGTTGNLAWLYSPDGINYTYIDSGQNISRGTNTVYTVATYFGTGGLQLALYNSAGTEIYNSNNATQYSGIQNQYTAFTNLFSPANSMAIKLYKYVFQAGNALTGTPDISGIVNAGANTISSFYQFNAPAGLESVQVSYNPALMDASGAFLSINIPSPLSAYTNLLSWTGPGNARSPGIYIRPVVRQTQIRYNWNVSSITGSQNYILSCIPTNGGAGGGTVVLSTPAIAYTFNGLTFGKTYAGAINASTIGSLSPSSIYRTVTTGNPPGVPTNPNYVSTPTSMTLSWDPPAGVQTPPIGWYVVKDGAVKFDTKGTSITIPFDQTPHNYTIQSVSDTGYSLGASTIIS